MIDVIPAISAFISGCISERVVKIIPALPKLLYKLEVAHFYVSQYGETKYEKCRCIKIVNKDTTE